MDPATVPLLVLDPPYSQARWMRETPPSLGSVVLVDGVAHAIGAREIRAVLDIAPWAPVCVLAKDRRAARRAALSGRICAVVSLGDTDGHGECTGRETILAAVRERMRPTPAMLADWLVMRARVPTLRNMLLELFERPAFNRASSASTPYRYSEALRSLGRWDAFDWQQVATLASIASAPEVVHRCLAADDLHTRAMRRRIPELLGVDERVLVERAGWEWVLEAALRRSGLFERAAARKSPLDGSRVAEPFAARREHERRQRWVSGEHPASIATYHPPASVHDLHASGGSREEEPPEHELVAALSN